MLIVLIKVKNRRIGTSRIVFLKKLSLKYFRQPEAYFQPSRKSTMKLFLQK